MQYAAGVGSLCFDDIDVLLLHGFLIELNGCRLHRHDPHEQHANN